MSSYSIGEVTRLIGLSADTLRYYEKIGLLSRVARTPSGRRLYTGKELSRLRFIRRAQKMDFALAEIGELLKVRDAPRRARMKARKLTEQKLADIETSLTDLRVLRDELQRLLGLCATRTNGCGIIEGIDKRERPTLARVARRRRQ